MKNIKKTSFFWAFIALGVILILGGLALAPFWGQIWGECPWRNLGSIVVSYIIAVLIILYLVLYVFKKFRRSKGKIRLLTLIEFILLSLIALGLLISRLQIFNITNPSVILGIALYVRGTIEIFRAYYYQKGQTVKYSVGWLVMAILFITAGIILMVTKVVTIELILYVVLATLALFGLYFIYYGVKAKPNR